MVPFERAMVVSYRLSVYLPYNLCCVRSPENCEVKKMEFRNFCCFHCDAMLRKCLLKVRTVAICDLIWAIKFTQLVTKLLPISFKIYTLTCTCSTAISFCLIIEVFILLISGLLTALWLRDWPPRVNFCSNYWFIAELFFYLLITDD